MKIQEWKNPSIFNAGKLKTTGWECELCALFAFLLWNLYVKVSQMHIGDYWCTDHDWLEVAITGPRVIQYRKITIYSDCGKYLYCSGNIAWSWNFGVVVLLLPTVHILENWGWCVLMSVNTCPTFVLVPPFAVLFHPTLAGRELKTDNRFYRICLDMFPEII